MEPTGVFLLFWNVQPAGRRQKTWLTHQHHHSHLIYSTRSNNNNRLFPLFLFFFFWFGLSVSRNITQRLQKSQACLQFLFVASNRILQSNGFLSGALDFVWWVNFKFRFCSFFSRRLRRLSCRDSGGGTVMAFCPIFCCGNGSDRYDNASLVSTLYNFINIIVWIRCDIFASLISLSDFVLFYFIFWGKLIIERGLDSGLA